MSRTKAVDRIQLGNRVLTLGEALDEGLLRLEQHVRVSRNREDSSGKPLKTVVFLAVSDAEGLFWQVGQKLYDSRMRRTREGS